jgi:hypothetical protein
VRNVYVVRSKRNPHLILCTDGEFYTPDLIGADAKTVKFYRNRRVYKIWDASLFDVCFADLYDDGRLEIPPAIIQRPQ